MNYQQQAERALRLKAMLKIEINTPLTLFGPSAYSIIKSEWGIRGTKSKVLERFSQLICPIHHWMLLPYTFDEPSNESAFICGYPDCTVLVWKMALTRGKIVPVDQETRTLRQKVHALFDPLWQEGVFTSRHRAYRWLADSMGINVNDCHIAYMDRVQCEHAVKIIAVRREIQPELLELL